MENSTFISTAEMAKRLGCTPSNVTALLRSGTIVGQRIPRGWKVKREDFEKYFGDYVTIETAEQNIETLKAEYEKAERYYNKKMRYLNMQIYTFSQITDGIQKIFERFQEEKEIRRKFKISELFERGMFNITNELSEEWGLTQERTRQVIYKECRRFFYYLKALPKHEVVMRENEALQMKLDLSEKTNRSILQRLGLYSAQEKAAYERQQIPIYMQKITEFDLTIRSFNCLRAADIETIGDLVQYSKHDLMRFRNFGKRSLNEIEDLLDSLGLSLSETNKLYL